MKHEEFINELLNDPEFAERYGSHKGHLKFLISKMLVDARRRKGMTQKDLAGALGTTQSSIARLESGAAWPKLEFLRRIADVYETDLIPPRFEFMDRPFDETMRRARSRVSGATFANESRSEDARASVGAGTEIIQLSLLRESSGANVLSDETRYERGLISVYA